MLIIRNHDHHLTLVIISVPLLTHHFILLFAIGSAMWPSFDGGGTTLKVSYVRLLTLCIIDYLFYWLYRCLWMEYWSRGMEYKTAKQTNHHRLPARAWKQCGHGNSIKQKKKCKKAKLGYGPMGYEIHEAKTKIESTNWNPWKNIWISNTFFPCPVPASLHRVEIN